jgi:glutamate carboxypeptidase
MPASCGELLARAGRAVVSALGVAMNSQSLAGVGLLLACITQTHGQTAEPILSLARQERPALLDTLRELVSIESGSRDNEGLDRVAELIAARLKALSGAVELVEPSDVYRMEDTPERIGRMVRATFTGAGAKKILLIAHMDTVYQRGMLAKQPFRVDGNRAYGLAIADDKQGIAVVLHTVAMLKALDFRQYGTLTVLINADEEISSPGSRSLITRLGAEHDATLSFEASRAESDKISLATSGIASIVLKVEGKASHAGFSPERGVNALYELAHQVLQTRDLSDPATGLKMNWTLANAGRVRNMIPPNAQAIADIRVLRIADYEAIEKKVRERIKTQLLPEAKVEMIFERRRPPLEASPASRALAAHAQKVYRELGRDLVVDPVAEGGGTDAAFASLNAKGPVIERMGLQGYGEHSIEAEYVLIDSIEPRLCLATRLIMDFAQGRAP